MTLEVIKKNYLEKYNQAYQLYARFPNDPIINERYHLLKQFVGDLGTIIDPDRYNQSKRSVRQVKLGQPLQDVSIPDEVQPVLKNTDSTIELPKDNAAIVDMSTEVKRNNGESLQKMYDGYTGKSTSNDAPFKTDDELINPGINHNGIKTVIALKTPPPIKLREYCDCTKAWQKGYKCMTCPGKKKMKF